MAQHRARDGEMVDAICQAHYGRTRGAVEKVYEANPGLAELGPRLPLGTLVELPEIAEPETTGKIAELWD